MNFEKQRQRMVQRQLSRRGIADEKVLAAMSEIPREAFVAAPFKAYAYADSALPIEGRQTISQPYTVAFMCESLRLRGTEKVLEVGTGSGYGASVLSQLASEVHTVERIPELGQQARARLRELGYDNVVVHIADGSLGLPSEAPFEAIIVTAAAETIPGVYREQLVDGGRIVMPVGPPQFGQRMCRFTLVNGQLEKEDLGGFAFVPLIGEHGLSDDAEP